MYIVEPKLDLNNANAFVFQTKKVHVRIKKKIVQNYTNRRSKSSCSVQPTNHFGWLFEQRMYSIIT